MVWTLRRWGCCVRRLNRSIGDFKPSLIVVSRAAWLMRLANRPDLTLKANFALMNGFDDRRLGAFLLGGERWASLPEPLQSVADDAARLVKRLPENIAKQLPPECWCSTRNNWPLWVAVVFGLAWSPVPNSLPHAVRLVPLNDRETILLESVSDMKEWLNLTDEQIAAVREKGWYSTLDDFAAASVQAIDVLMSWLDDVPKPETEATSEPPKPVEPQAETLAGGDYAAGDRAEAIGKPAKLRPCDDKAWSQYRLAIEDNPELTTDQAAYDWFIEHVADEGESLPAFASWVKYVRLARADAGEQKNKRGVGHETRSVVPAKRL